MTSSDSAASPVSINTFGMVHLSSCFEFRLRATLRPHPSAHR
jgi:hypothetical protein